MSYRWFKPGGTVDVSRENGVKLKRQTQLGGPHCAFLHSGRVPHDDVPVQYVQHVGIQEAGGPPLGPLVDSGGFSNESASDRMWVGRKNAFN